jgi:hypothetical protein
MKAVRVILILCLFILSCVSLSHIPREITQDIPKGSKLIKLYSGDSVEAYFKRIYRALAAAGFSIKQENKEMGTLSTDFKDIGQGTTLKIVAYIEEYNSGSVATLRGEWGITSSTAAGLSAGFGVEVGGSTAEEAVWSGSGRPKLAFGELAVIANRIEHERIEYSNE